MKGSKFSDVSKVGKCGGRRRCKLSTHFQSTSFSESRFHCLQVVTITAPSKHLHCNNFLLICLSHSTELERLHSSKKTFPPTGSDAV
jgi:hypothetical protein